MTGNYLTWPHVTGSDPELTSFHRMSPGSGSRRPISQVLGSFELLQGCNSQKAADTCQEMTTWPQVTGCDPEVTSFDRKWAGSGCKTPISEFWVHLSFYRAPTCRRWHSHDEIISRHPAWSDVTWKWHHLTGSHLEVAVEGL